MPVFSENPIHWTLLSIDIQDGEVREIRFRDSFGPEAKEARANAQFLLNEALGLDRPLPPRLPTVFQKGATCGFWITSFQEEEVREHLGQGWHACGPHAANVESWKVRLQKVSVQLKLELNKLKQEETKAKQKAAAAEEKLKQSKKYETEQAQKKIRDAELVQLALELAERNRSFQVSDLSVGSYGMVKAAGLKAGICSRCRWQSGCLSCDESKAFAYYKRLEDRDHILQSAHLHIHKAFEP